ncbi:MAG: glycosyltransferase family 9 protein [Bacteroidales bacterium]|jgi:ADP-heptose:LPS heptosyltransferase|nr:glycosyltransferase family 9 protein [Bacteroidales bacterium]
MSKIHNRTILISRTDGIGDVILTLPLCGILKECFPQTKIVFLGNNYTQPIIACCKDIDRFLSWDALKDLPQEKQTEALKQEKIDVFLHIFPSKAIAKLAKQAAIPVRFGTSHRWYNRLYCNETINLSRRHSDLHEAQLNLLLLRPVLRILNMKPLEWCFKHINFQNTAANDYKDLIEQGKFNLILHPKSNKSAREWGETNFCRLIDLLPSDRFKVFVCGTKQEGDMIRQSILETKKNRIIDLTGQFSLSEYIDFIAQADGLIAASTGPLHISAILNKHSIGLFPPIRPMNPQRWRPLGEKVKIFCEDKECNRCKKTSECQCMQAISPNAVAEYLLSCTK